jgi:hypothetical protein
MKVTAWTLGALMAAALLCLAIPAAAQNQAPTANAGPDQTVEATAPAGTPVTLDGSASTDPDLDTLTYLWKEGDTVLAGPVTTAQSVVTLSLGTHVITLTVDDGNGGTDTDDVQVVVQDTTPPDIQSVTADPDTLWPPNHKMRDVTVTAVLTDNGNPAPTWSITGGTVTDLPKPPKGNSQAKKPPKPPKDVLFIIVDNDTVQLRAERLGNSNGRTYTITITATDGVNTSTATVDVTVPHDKGKNK